VVVDHLRVDVRPAAVHGEPRPLFGAADLLADPLVQPLPDLFFRSHAHLIAPAGVPGGLALPGVPAAPSLIQGVLRRTPRTPRSLTGVNPARSQQWLLGTCCSR